MFAQRNALVSNLNFVHIQHVSLGVHLSLRPELVENPMTRDQDKVARCQHLWKDLSGTAEVDTNSNDPSLPCQCCDKHREQLNPCLDSTCEENHSPGDMPSSPLSPSSPSSDSCSSSDFTLDESPVSMYYKEFLPDGLESPDQQPDIVPLDAQNQDSFTPTQQNCAWLSPKADSPTLSHGRTNPTTPNTPEGCKNMEPVIAPSTEWELGSSLDANCNAVTGSKPFKSQLSGCLSCDNVRQDEGKKEDSNNGNMTVTPGQAPMGAEDDLLPGFSSLGNVSVQSPKKTITSFNELAQKRRRSAGGQPSQQAKKDRSDWLILFSPDRELTASTLYPGVLPPHIPPGKEITTFREIKYRNKLIKQSSQQVKPQTLAEKGLPSLPAGERGQWCEHSDIGKKGPNHLIKFETQHNEKKDKTAEHVLTPHQYSAEKKVQSGSAAFRQHTFGSVGTTYGLWPTRNHCASFTGTDMMRPWGGYVQLNWKDGLNQAKEGAEPLPAVAKAWNRGTADGGDKKIRDALGSCSYTLLPCNPSLQTLPARMSPVGAFSPPHRGLLPLLDTHDVSGLQSPFFPKTRILPRLTPERGSPCAPHQDTPGTVHEQLMADVEQQDRKGLLVRVGSSVDKIICHFNSSRNQVQKALLGDSRLSPELGYLLLSGLCPSLYALLANGLKPFQKDVIIGRRRLNPWSLVEASIKADSALGSMHSLMCSVSHLSQLRDPQRKFNAFIFGLLNTKQLDIWISHLHQSHDLYSTFYFPSSFLTSAALSQTELYEELILTLQPLSALTFHVDLLFEHHHLSLQEPPASHWPHTQSDLWGKTSLKQILQWGGQIVHSLTGNTEQGASSSFMENSQGLSTAENSCPPCADTTTKVTQNWWEHLSQASTSRKESFGFAHLKKLRYWAGKELQKENTESTKPLAPEEAFSGGDTHHSSEESQLLKSNEEYTLAGAEGGPTGNGSSSAPAEQCRKPEDHSTALHHNNEDWGNTWFGNLFGASSSNLREPENKRVKSRRPSSWLTPSVNMLHLIRQPSLTERITRIPLEEDRDCQQITSKQERSVRALCDHTGTEEVHLSFKKGDILQLLDTVDEDWICCRCGTDTGLVPVGYTSLIL
ncbi:AP-4 complex accessory subunit RUSC1 [Pelodytes ibericus]